MAPAAPPHPILFTLPNFTTAGSGRAMLHIVERLDRDRFRPTVCVAARGGRLEAEVERLGVELLELPFTVPARPLVKLPGRLRAAARPFRPHRFRLWHSFHYLDDYTEPLVARLAGARGWIYTKKNMSWSGRAWKLRTLLAGRVLAQNRDMVERFFAAWPFRGKTRLVPRGVDVEGFRPGIPPRLALRRRFGIGDDPLVASVAHLLPVKGQGTLIAACARLPGVTLLLAGSPLDEAYAASLRTLAAELGVAERVHFLGPVDDVAALLAEVDVFVLATLDQGRREGCPVALLEAMASGCCAVASDVPGARDLLEDGMSGFLLPPEDPERLAALLGRLAADPELRRRSGAAARRRAVDSFSLAREVAAHEAVYTEILG